MDNFKSAHYWASLDSDKRHGHWERWNTHPNPYWKRAALHHKLHAVLKFDRTLVRQLSVQNG
jgi:hypothetical protein